MRNVMRGDVNTLDPDGGGSPSGFAAAPTDGSSARPVLRPADAARAAAATRPDRPATAVLYDAPDARLMVFRLAPGQVVPLHRSTSTVLLHVVEGCGVFLGPDGEHPCATGDIATFVPNEPHGMRAVEHELLLLATIAPRPGGR